MSQSDKTDEEVIASEFNRLRGRLAGFIEACGLDERQERGAIQTMKSLSYDSQKVFIETFIDSDSQENLF